MQWVGKLVKSRASICKSVTPDRQWVLIPSILTYLAMSLEKEEGLDFNR